MEDPHGIPPCWSWDNELGAPYRVLRDGSLPHLDQPIQVHPIEQHPAQLALARRNPHPRERSGPLQFLDGPRTGAEVTSRSTVKAGPG